jgi:outer membrane protein assembly factor BamB
MKKSVYWSMMVWSLTAFLQVGTLEASYNYQDLTPQGIPSGVTYYVKAINDAQQIVGYCTQNIGGTYTDQAFLWDPVKGPILLKPMPGSTDCYAYGINKQGQIVGQYRYSGYNFACVWTDPSQPPTDLSNYYVSCAYGINDAGVIVGVLFANRDTDYNDHAVIWTEQTNYGWSDLGTLGGNTSCAMAINNAGQIVGRADDLSGKSRACIWNPPQYNPQKLADILYDMNSTALAINNQGNVAGEYVNGGLPMWPQSVFYWDHLTGLQLFGMPSIPGYEFHGLSDSNQLIYSMVGGVNPSYWTPSSGNQSLNNQIENLPLGVTLSAVNAISPQKGHIVGRDSRGHICLLTFISLAGNLKWGFATPANTGLSSPALGPDGTVYVGASYVYIPPSDVSQLYAVKPDGTKKWVFTTGGTYISSPALGPDGTVYVASSDGKLYAVDPGGNEKWTFTTGGAVLYSSPALGPDGTVYVGSTDGNLYAVKPGGTLKWAFKTDGAVKYSSPALGPDGTVYVGSMDGKLYAVKSDGTLKWAFSTGGPVQSSPALAANRTVYVCSDDGNLYAVKPGGTLKWAFATGGGAYSFCSPVLGPDGTVYVGSSYSSGKFHAVNPDGTQKWAFKTDSAVKSSPALGADGTVYIASSVSLYAVRPDGTQKWAFWTNNAANSSPALSPDGTIYIGTSVNTLNAVYSDSPGLVNSDWPMFHQNLNLTGFQPIQSPEALTAPTILLLLD